MGGQKTIEQFPLERWTENYWTVFTRALDGKVLDSVYLGYGQKFDLPLLTDKCF